MARDLVWSYTYVEHVRLDHFESCWLEGPANGRLTLFVADVRSPDELIQFSLWHLNTAAHIVGLTLVVSLCVKSMCGPLGHRVEVDWTEACVPAWAAVVGEENVFSRTWLFNDERDPAQ